MFLENHITPNVNLQNADVFSALPTLQNDFFDVCIVDPPYGASTTKNWSYDENKKLQGFGGDWKLTSEMWDLLSQNDSFQQTYNWLTASHETILWVHKGDAKHRNYVFNYEASKEYSLPCDLLKERGKQMRTVWDIPNNKSKEEMQFGSHPTQKPIRIAERILTLCGVKGGNLLVPFVGSGTEMVAGLQFGMNVYGFELEEDYYKLAKKRIDAVANNPQTSLF